MGPTTQHCPLSPPLTTSLRACFNVTFSWASLAEVVSASGRRDWRSLSMAFSSCSLSTRCLSEWRSSCTPARGLSLEYFSTTSRARAGNSKQMWLTYNQCNSGMSTTPENWREQNERPMSRGQPGPDRVQGTTPSGKKKKKNLKQSWLPAFWKKIQNTQKIKKTLFNKTKQDKTCKIFEVIFFFKLCTIQQKTVKPTFLCPLDARKLNHEASWHLTKISWFSCFLVYCTKLPGI